MSASGTTLLTELQRKAMLAQFKWRKCPSVTPGGKPFFWYLRVEWTTGECGARPFQVEQHWIVWNRRLKRWQHERVTSLPGN